MSVFTGVLPTNLYEYGTFTPTITSSGSAGTISYTAQLGAYHKDGNSFFIFFVVAGSITGSPSGTLFLNLPVNRLSSPNVHYNGYCGIFNIASTADDVTPQIGLLGTNVCYFDSATAIKQIATGNFNIQGSINYLITPP